MDFIKTVGNVSMIAIAFIFCGWSSPPNNYVHILSRGRWKRSRNLCHSLKDYFQLSRSKALRNETEFRSFHERRFALFCAFQMWKDNEQRNHKHFQRNDEWSRISRAFNVTIVCEDSIVKMPNQFSTWIFWSVAASFLSYKVFIDTTHLQRLR